MTTAFKGGGVKKLQLPRLGPFYLQLAEQYVNRDIVHLVRAQSFSLIG
jgi:hypothetical protein